MKFERAVTLFFILGGFSCYLMGLLGTAVTESLQTNTLIGCLALLLAVLYVPLMKAPANPVLNWIKAVVVSVVIGILIKYIFSTF